MLHKRMNSIMTTGLMTAILWLVPIVVRAAEVSDGGGFFSAEALAKANQSIRELEQKSGHEIRIETFTAVPADKVEAVGKMERKERDAFFSKWVFERAEAKKSRGLVVLICREPSHLNVWVGNPLDRAGFGKAQAKAVQEVLLTHMKAKEYDKALTEAVAQLSTTFSGLSHAKAKTSAEAPATHEPKRVGHVTPTSPKPALGHQAPLHAPQQSGWTGVLVVLMFVVGGIFVVSVIGRLFGGGRSSGMGGYGPGGYGGGGGGGFMSSLAGGIFGAMAGNWMYDQFSGRHALGGESHSTGDSSGSNDSSGGSGFDSGSDSSDSGFAGGTDYGGGDFGDAGDSGGGSDFGGGGDF